MTTVDVEKLIKPHLINVKTYEPVDPPELLAERAGIPREKIIKLNGNENPYGGSPKVSEALANLEVHIYPRPVAEKVTKRPQRLYRHGHRVYRRRCWQR